jgi:hypothetical protein
MALVVQSISNIMLAWPAPPPANTKKSCLLLHWLAVTPANVKLLLMFLGVIHNLILLPAVKLLNIIVLFAATLGCHTIALNELISTVRLPAIVVDVKVKISLLGNEAPVGP